MRSSCIECDRLRFVLTEVIRAYTNIVWRRCQAIERGDRRAVSSLKILKRDANEARRIAREAVTTHATTHDTVT